MFKCAVMCYVFVVLRTVDELVCICELKFVCVVWYRRVCVLCSCVSGAKVLLWGGFCVIVFVICVDSTLMD